MSPNNQVFQQQQYIVMPPCEKRLPIQAIPKTQTSILWCYWATGPCLPLLASVLVEAQNGVFSFLYSISEWQRKEIWKIEIEELQHKKWSRLTQNCVCRGAPPLSPSPPLLCWHQRPAPTLSLQQERGFSIWAIYSHLSFDHHQILGSWKL